MCSEIVQSENPHSFQEPASAPNSSDATRANPTVVFNTTTAQNSLNASEIATGFFMVQSLKMPLLTSTFPLKSSFEPRTDTGSVQFSYFTCLHTTIFIFLSLFALVETITLKIWERPMCWPAKCSLPVAVRGSKTLHA